MSDDIYEVLIIGAGCAGLAAGMYSGRFGMKTAIIGELPGGTITLTDVVENYPGIVSTTGQGLADMLLAHAKAYDVPIIQEKAEKISKGADGSFTVKTDGGSYSSKSIIYATGTEWKKLNVPGEKEFANKGVHYCALCDGAFYKNKIMVVAGSGDSAAKESLLLSGLGSHVYLLVRGDALHGEPINNKRVAENRKITVLTNTQILEVKGDKKVTHLKLNRKVKPFDGGEETDLLPTNSLFVEIGHVAKSELAKELGVALNKKGEIIIDREAKTNIPGFFAAGDVVDTVFKQAITGASEGVTASYSAYQYLGKE